MRSLLVIEALEPVIDWHRWGLVPLGPTLTGDERCRLVHGDFFAWVGRGGVAATEGTGRCHALLVDIDHSPRHVLHPSHAKFYSPEGLGRVVARLHPGGVFALWSDDASEASFLGLLQQAFASCRAEVVSFVNPLTGGTSANTVYVAVTDR